MANGSHKPGPARGDRYREKYRHRGHLLAEKLDGLNKERELPPYRAELDSQDSTVDFSRNGLRVRSALPRFARQAIGFGLAVMFVLVGIGVLRWLW